MLETVTVQEVEPGVVTVAGLQTSPVIVVGGLHHEVDAPPSQGRLSDIDHQSVEYDWEFDWNVYRQPLANIRLASLRISKSEGEAVTGPQAALVGRAGSNLP